jgi:lysozyme
MRLTDNGRRLIQGFEGLSLKAYPDPPGDPQRRHSIGYGHSGAKPGDVITRADADRLFDADVAKYETAVSYAAPSATPQQFDSMVSLAYNVGTKGFADSTVARLHNAGDFAGAADAFRMWNKAGGAVHSGLVARREKERAVYLNGYPGVYSTPPMTPATPPIEWSVPSSAAASRLPAAALALAGVGLVFFCPSCSARLAAVGVEVDQ